MRGPRRFSARGRVFLLRGTWILVISTATRFLAELARASVDASLLAWIVVLGGLGQVVGLSR